MSAPTAPELSVVVPVYNEAGNVVPLFVEIRDVLQALGRRFEVIFINDGSTDTTLDELRELVATEPSLRILDLAANAGEAGALCAGFNAARGALVVTLDGDGQNPPHDIPRLLDRLEQGGYRVVSGWRQQRQEGFVLRVLPSRIANWLIAAVTRLPVHDNGCGLKVYRREVVAGASLPRGMNRFMPAIFGVTAAEVAEVPVDDRRRRHGQSHYGISRTLVVMRDLLALRLIVANPRVGEPLSAGVTIAAALAALAGLWCGSAALTVVGALGATIGAMIWWNLQRFNRAQRDGVYRVRREYAGEQTENVKRKT